MKKNNTYLQVGTSVVLFATLFACLGYYIPSIWYHVVPIGNIISVNSFIATDIKTTDLTQQLYFDRDIQSTFSGDLIYELDFILKNNNDNVEYIEIKTVDHTDDRLFESGHKIVVINRPIPSNLPVGEYYWVMGITAHLPHDVDRQFDFKTTTFKVTN